ncbi:MAG: PQQ-binding-like beta-propeller repeat protein [Kiloniellales bacterium]
MSAPLTRVLFLAGCILLLAACETTEEVLPGERVAILALDQGLTPDPAIADIPVRLAEPYVNKAWTHYGGGPTHAMHHLSLGEAPRKIWSRDVGTGSSDARALLAQPLVADGVVYSMDALSTVTAYDAGTGKVLWRADLEPEDEDDGYFGGGIAYDGGRIFVSTGFARAFALDAKTGDILWQQRVPAPVRAAPAVAEGRVFVITLDNQTIALSASDGRQLWRHSGIQETTTLIGGASPAVSGSTLVVPYSSGEIVGLLAENGRLLWGDNLASVNRFDPLGDVAHIRGTPVIDRGMVYAISHSGRMVAIDLRRGERAWERPIGGVEMPWVAGEYIFVLTNDAQLLCITRKEGRIRWIRPLPRFRDPEDQEGPIHWTGPVLASDRLIVAGSEGEAISISPYTGQVLGLVDLPGGAAVAPVVADGGLYFLTDGGTLVALR